MLKVGDRFYPKNSDREWAVLAIVGNFYMADAYRTCKTPFLISRVNFDIKQGRTRVLIAENFDEKGRFRL